MISKYLEKYCAFYLSKYWVNKKKFENILKLKISKDFFQKKISSDEKSKYVKEIFEVIKFYDARGFFDEEKLIELLKESSMLSKATKIRTKQIEEIEESLQDAGAIYTKQLGAGGGGFIFCLFKKEPNNIPFNQIGRAHV